MRLRAPAKINLGLELTARRPDGYHEVASVMLSVGLCDQVQIRRTDSGGVGGCGAAGGFARTGLTDAALELLAAESGGELGLQARVAKNVPAAAGLGGGSSDAAVALIGASQLGRNRISGEELARIAGRIGSDAAFFLSGGCALVSGRGQIIDRALPMPDVWVLLANPGAELSTPHVYRELEPSELTDGTRTARLAESIAEGAPRWDLMHNGLQAPALRLCPQIQGTLDLLAGHTPHHQLSGSGPTCFGLFGDREPAAAAERELADSGHWTWLGRPHGPWRVSDLRINQRSR